ncbi:MAG TPA: Rid family hydrolase, partial [Ramlibacter sp.]|nr:Rid family hydrolase [Ramlibacter sp.]
MARRRIGSGSTFEAQIGYSRAVVDGDWIFVSGTTGFDYATMTLREGVVAQCEQCLRNIAGALEQAGSSLADVVRVTYLLPDAAEFE